MLAAFVALYMFLHGKELPAGWLEDMPVYKLAVHAFMAGADPYAPTSTGLHFVYPPIVLYAASWLARVLPGESEWFFVACIHVVCVLALPFVLARYYLRQSWLTPWMAALIYAGEPNFCSVQALYSSNVAPSLYLAALLAAIPGIRNNRWTVFYAVIFVAGAVKITFILLLLLPILAGLRQWWRSIATAVAVAAVYAVQKGLMPSLYAGYKRALVEQITMQKLYGFGVFGVVAGVEQRLHHNIVGITSYAVHAVFAAIVFAFLLALKYRGADKLYDRETSRGDASLWMGLLLISIIVINPRVLHYDMYIALFAAFVVLAISWRLRGWQLVALVPVLYLPSLLVLPGVHPWIVHQLYQLFLVLLALGVGIKRLWRNTGSSVAAVSR